MHLALAAEEVEEEEEEEVGEKEVEEKAWRGGTRITFRPRLTGFCPATHPE